MEPPTDIAELAKALGIGPKRLGRLASEHGDELLSYLQGLWHWTEKQDRVRFLRRRPPATVSKAKPTKKPPPIPGSPRSGGRRFERELLPPKQHRSRRRPPDAEAIEAASEASAYTDRPRDAMVDAGEAVPTEYQKELTIEAHSRWSEEQQSQRSEELARRDARRVGAKLRELAIQAARAGADPTAILADFERQIKERMRHLGPDP